MSIYSALSIDIPVINYSVLHQVKKGTEAKEYAKTIHEMHRMVLAETDAINATWKSQLAEMTATSVQSTRGALSQFLTLPLDGDVREVQRILEDQLRLAYKQVLPKSKLGVIATSEGKFTWDREQNSLLQSLLTRGKEYLKKLKFRVAPSDGQIYESGFVVEGGFNLDVIEHIVRDRMGIYATAHGQHIQESEPFVFAAHNLALAHGTFDKAEARFEAAIHFSKGKSQYGPFRRELTDLLTTAQEELKLTHCSLWQRKLGLGAGTEFNIRLRDADKKGLREFVLMMSKAKDQPLAHAQLFENGQLLIKELTR